MVSASLKISRTWAALKAHPSPARTDRGGDRMNARQSAVLFRIRRATGLIVTVWFVRLVRRPQHVFQRPLKRGVVGLLWAPLPRALVFVTLIGHG